MTPRQSLPLIPSLLALLISGAAVSPAAAPPPIINNAGFEQGSDNKAAHWGWWSRAGAGSATWTDSDPREGKHCVCIRHDAERDWAYSNDTRLAVHPGEAFKVTASAKVETGQANFTVVALNKGELVSWDIGSAAAKGSKWHTIEAVAEVPAGCDQIYVRFTGGESTLLWLDDVRIEPTKIDRTPKPKVDGYARERVRENIDRALIARLLDNGHVYLGWRLLPGDPPDAGFDVLRETAGGPAEKITAAPITGTTDFIDQSAPAGKALVYQVRAVTGTNRDKPGHPAVVPADAKPSPHLSFKLQGAEQFRKVGIADLDGDGRYDFVIKSPEGNVDPYVNYWQKSPDTFKFDAYTADGAHLWHHDLGWSIERGIWYSPFVVFDLNGDGRAEVALKSGEDDPRDQDGRVQSGPEFLTILDGMSGQPITRIAWPDREIFATTGSPYNYASRNQLGIAFLDGKTPCLIVERGTYNTIVVVAYELRGNSLHQLWQWDNRQLPGNYRGQGAHWMHAADVDGDGRDELVIGSIVLDDNGDALWTTGLGHPDHSYLGDLDPSRPGLEIYYGIESQQKESNGMCMVDAANGKIIWGHQGPTRHVHSFGMCSDIDPAHPGAECYSADTDQKKNAAWARLRSARGEVISEDLAWGFGPLTAYWDADPQREIIWKNKISDFGGDPLPTRIDGSIVAVADILGDWREELIVSTKGELRIHTTTIPATDRRPCLMTDPVYRIDVAHTAMGYTQVPMLSYDVASH